MLRSSDVSNGTQLHDVPGIPTKNRAKTGRLHPSIFQYTLPSQEQYICKSPFGCLVTPPNTYFRLIKTLYGLKRSPRHWYEKSKKVLAFISLHLSLNVILDSSPIYLGIYVDDCIYFSTYSEVEKKSETALILLLNVEFTGPPQYFLELKVKCKKDENHLNVFLSQEVAVIELLHRTGLSNISTKSNNTRYRA